MNWLDQYKAKVVALEEAVHVVKSNDRIYLSGNAATPLLLTSALAKRAPELLNIEVNHATLAQHTFQHELQAAADAGMLGSIDANRGDYQNGWDTDQFPADIFELTQAMLVVLQGGGMQGGGTNFDAKIRRNSTDNEDLFIAHIGAMDIMARALETAAVILEESPYKKMVADRYASYDAGKGKEFEEGKLSFEDVYAYAKTISEIKQISGKQELYEAIVNMYI